MIIAKSRKQEAKQKLQIQQHTARLSCHLKCTSEPDTDINVKITDILFMKPIIRNMCCLSLSQNNDFFSQPSQAKPVDPLSPHHSAAKRTCLAVRDWPTLMRWLNYSTVADEVVLEEEGSGTGKTDSVRQDGQLGVRKEERET